MNAIIINLLSNNKYTIITLQIYYKYIIITLLSNYEYIGRETHQRDWQF